MPDLFVAPSKTDEKEVMHKRVPVVSESTNKTPQTLPISPEPALTDRTKILQGGGKTNKTLHKETSDNNIPLFTSFWQNPTGVYFDTQEVDEHILLFIRRHPITNFSWIVTTIFFLLFPFVCWYVAFLLQKPLMLGSYPFTIAILLFYLLIVMTNAYASFLSWYYNISLITEKRVVDIELTNIIGEKISATKISLVQDLNYQQTGAIRSIFNYGDVLIQTAGTQDNFLIHAAPKPEIVVRVLEDIIGEDGNHV